MSRFVKVEGSVYNLNELTRYMVNDDKSRMMFQFGEDRYLFDYDEFVYDDFIQFMKAPCCEGDFFDLDESVEVSKDVNDEYAGCCDSPDCVACTIRKSQE